MNLSLEYIAGFFDGEGHVSITEMHRRNTIDPKLVVRLTNTFLPVLDYIKGVYGGTIYKQPKVKSHYLQVYVLSLTVEQSKKFLTDILPFLVIKKEQAEEALKFSRTVYRRGKKNVSDEEKEIRMECMDKLWRLKRQEF